MNGATAHSAHRTGDQCRHDRLRRRHRRRIRPGPGCRGLRLPLRSGHHVNDTSTCSVVSRSRCSAPAEGSPVPVPVNGLAGPPADGVPVVEPVTDVAGPPPPAALPPPGQPPSVPPVVNEDGTPQTFGQGGFLRDIWRQFHNGVPSVCSTAPCLRRRIPQCRRHRVIPCYCRRRVPRRAESRIQQTLTTPRMGSKAQSIATQPNRRAAPHQEPPER